MTFGFSRDDVEGRMMSAYLEQGLLSRNPFEVVDAQGVGELVRIGVERGRAVRPGLKIGVCGEHGGDPASIATFYEAGLDYVSCSPFRVPVARLAAAQAVLESTPVAKKAVRRPAAKKPAAKKTVRKALAKKTAAKKTAAKRAPARRVAKKAAKRVPVRRGTTKTAAKRAPARRVAKKAATGPARTRAVAKRGRRR
jgi:pyruvate,orthophosphate dikinase